MLEGNERTVLIHCDSYFYYTVNVVFLWFVYQKIPNVERFGKCQPSQIKQLRKI